MSTTTAADDTPAVAPAPAPASAPQARPPTPNAPVEEAAAEGEATQATASSSTGDSNSSSKPPPPDNEDDDDDDRTVSEKPAKMAKTEPASVEEAATTAPTDDINLTIPKASIKRIMKLDPDTKQLSQDAIVLMCKATELFVDKLAKASHSMAVSNKRKTIKYEDIADARLSDKNMEFLDGVVPQI